MKRFLAINLLAYLMINMLLIRLASRFLNGFHKGLNTITMKIPAKTTLSGTYVLMASEKITNDEIISEVARFFETTPEKIVESNRFRKVVFPRQVAIWFCVNNNIINSPDQKAPKYKWKELAIIFHKKNHATIIYSFRTIENLIETDKKVKRIIDEISHNIEVKTKTIKEYESNNN